MASETLHKILPNPAAVIPSLSVTFVGRDARKVEKMRIAMLGAQSPLAVRPKASMRSRAGRSRYYAYFLSLSSFLSRSPSLSTSSLLRAYTQVVYDWLRALKAVNPLYADIVIDDSEATMLALHALPGQLVDMARVADSSHVNDVEDRARERADDVARVRTEEPDRKPN